ncbi:hypothetical protein PUR57_27210 [Streptomyces sp. JV176]|uniref:hypothetical protein n=1 Tax=unclassified Streptomyces TaxID=2593676 RepID=UPI002E7AA845|nr:hypothetical protein [Streptomyces sp. JV176]MEE1802337.1 hypothetical protein [Streptomyces sp. JV176]
MAEYGESNGGGGSTSFEAMSHEQMLAWLDKANSATVQAAADRLSAAAAEIRDIAQQFQFRPQRVEWEGEGKDAFESWGASLASSTYRLAEYSDEASKWLSRTSDAIAVAQSSIPRDVTGAKANLAAANAHRNDPDAGLVAGKSLETLEAGAEKSRLEAADEMRKLSQSYQQAQTQMTKLEVPTFQPPPGAFVPDGGMGDNNEESLGRSGNSSGSATPGGVDSPLYSHSEGASGAGGVAAQSRAAMTSPPLATVPERATTTEIAGAETLPTTLSPSSAPPTVPVTVGRPEGGTPAPGMLPPALVGSPVPAPGQPGTGRPSAGVRAPLMPGQSGPTGGPTARAPQERAIVGGRPVPPNSGQPTGGIPRGTVIGGESAHGRPPVANGMGAGMGRPQQPGTTPGRPFTPGGSGLVRGANGEGRQAGQAARGGAVPPRSSGAPRRDDARGNRPDYLVEDEETWQQGGRRIVPPVID